MKFSLLVTFLLLSYNIAFSQFNPAEFLPENILKQFKKTSLGIWGVDSVYCYKYNDAAGDIIIDQRTYNIELTSNGLIVKELTEINEDGVWKKFRKTENTYLPSEEIELQVISLWNNNLNNWENSERTSYRYNSNDKLTSLLLEKFNSQTGTWEFINRNLYKYFNLPQPDEFLLQEWDGSNWKDKGQIFYSYNSNLQITSSIFRIWNESTNQWVNGNQTFETYDGDFKQIKTDRQTWNIADDDWDNSTRVTYTYNQDDELARVLNEIWVNNDSTWTFTDDNLYGYDFRDRNNEFVIRNYDGSDFLNYYRNKRTFDLNDNIKKIENQFYQGGFWVNNNYCDLFYSELQSSDLEEITQENNCTIINSGNSFSLECQEYKNDQNQLIFEIYGFDGKLVFTKKVSSNSTIEYPLTNGAYLISYRNNSQVIASKKEIIID